MRSIKSLLDAGCSLQKVRRAFQEIERLGLDAGARIETDGQGVYLVDEATVTDALRRGQLSFFVGMREMTTKAAVLDGGFVRDAEAVGRAIKAAERDLTRRRRTK